MSIITKKESEELAQKEKRLQTACWDCVFSSQQEEGCEDPNSFCSAGRLQSFQDGGASVIDVYSEQKNKKFKIVSDRICNMFRTEEWEKIKKSQGNSEDSLVKIAREEIKIQCTYVLYVRDSTDKEEEDRKQVKSRLSKIAEKMKEMWFSEIPPSNIIIINNTYIKPYDFINYLRIEIESLPFNPIWNMEYIRRDHSVIKDLDRSDAYAKCMDVIVKTDKSKSQWYALFFEEDKVNTKYLSEIDECLNDKMKRFLVLFPENKDEGGLLIQKMAYKQFYGNRDGDFVEKLKKGAEEQKCQNLIQPLNQAIKSQ